MAKKINARLQQKHDIEANWKLAVNFIPLVGEIIVYDPDETHSYPRFKLGDGVIKDGVVVGTLVNDLPFLHEETDLKLENLKAELLGSEELEGTYDTLREIGAWIEKDGIDTTELTTAIAEEAAKREAGDVQPNWNETNTSNNAYIQNKPNIKNGDGANSILIGEGDANGKYSIAGGTNDKDLISNLAGDLSSIIGNIEIAKADGDMSMSFGAGTVSRTAGTMAIGANSKAGIKGFYFTKVSGNTLTLSTKQPTILSSSAKWSSTAQTQLNNWKSGDTITIVNDANYVMCATIASISNTESAASITVNEDLPFTKRATIALPILNDFAVINHNKPDAGIIGLGLGSVAMGLKNEAHGLFSMAEGRENLAAGNFAHAEGLMTKAGHTGHSEGYKTNAKGNFSHAENSNTTSSGENSHAEGLHTESGGTNSHAEGNGAKAMGLNSHAEGNGTEVTGNDSHAEGNGVKVHGYDSHGEGYQNIITEGTSHAHAEGARNTVSGLSAHGEGDSNISTGKGSHTEGVETIANTEGAHAEGHSTIAGGVIEGITLNVYVESSTKFRYSGSINDISNNIQVGTILRYQNKYAVVTKIHLGLESEIWVNRALVEDGVGDISITVITGNGKYAHAEGYTTVASGEGSHSEGLGGKAVGKYTHVEGANGEASGNYSHVEGLNCKTKTGASGAHAEGEWTEANAQYSHAEGWHTVTNERCSHVQGKYNELTTDGFAHIVGGGTSESNRKNIHTIDWDGNAKFAGTIYDKNGELSLDRIFPEDLTNVQIVEITGKIRARSENDIVYYCGDDTEFEWWGGPSYGDDWGQDEPTHFHPQPSDKPEYDYMLTAFTDRDITYYVGAVKHMVLAEKIMPTDKTTVNREGIINLSTTTFYKNLDSIFPPYGFEEYVFAEKEPGNYETITFPVIGEDVKVYIYCGEDKPTAFYNVATPEYEESTHVYKQDTGRDYIVLPDDFTYGGRWEPGVSYYNSAGDIIKIVYQRRAPQGKHETLNIENIEKLVNNSTDKLREELTNLPNSGEENVQSDWSVTDTSSDAYIKNKPAISLLTNTAVLPATGIGGAHKTITNINNGKFGNRSLMSGYECSAVRDDSHAMGYRAKALGAAAFATCESTASGRRSFSTGIGTVAQGYCQSTFGQFNTIDNSQVENANTRGKYVQIVGNGTSDANRSNAHTLDWDGNAWYAGKVEATAAKINGTEFNSTFQFKLTYEDGTVKEIKVLGVEV